MIGVLSTFIDELGNESDASIIDQLHFSIISEYLRFFQFFILTVILLNININSFNKNKVYFLFYRNINIS